MSVVVSRNRLAGETMSVGSQHVSWYSQYSQPGPVGPKALWSVQIIMSYIMLHISCT